MKSKISESQKVLKLRPSTNLKSFKFFEPQAGFQIGPFPVGYIYQSPQELNKRGDLKKVLILIINENFVFLETRIPASTKKDEPRCLKPN